MADPFFDTNILIDWLLDRPQATEELARYGSHRISRIVWTEILAGEPEAQRPTIRKLLSGFDVVEIDAQIAAVAADIRFYTRMTLLDALILATARVHGALLVSRNTKDFPAGMPGIRVPYTL